MAGFQFVHMQTFARRPGKAGVGTGFVFAEAARRPGSCDHVEAPGEPLTVFGQDVAGIEAEHDAAVEAARTVNAKGQSRRLRQDQHTLLTVVASHPATPDQVRADPAVAKAVGDWQERTVAWLREAHGDALRGVVRHDDEGHVHLHAYVLPEAPGMAARALHPGVMAKKAAMASEAVRGLPEKAANRLGDKAYRDAMRGWQDRYWQAVGLPSGLARLGPGRRRLSRAEWQAEQAQAERAGLVEERLAVVGKAEACIERGQVAVASLRDQVVALRAEKEAAVLAAEEAKRQADATAAEARRSAAGVVAKARRQAARIVQGAQRQAEALSSVGAALGAVWWGLLGASPGRAAERADERARGEEREVARRALATVQGELGDVRKELREVRQVKAELVESLQRVAGQRDAAWQALHGRGHEALAPRRDLTG